MTIGEVAARAGLATSAIRYYEKTGLLEAPARANGRRVYQPEVLSQLVIICFAKDTGFTLPEIRLLLHGFPQTTTASARWRKLACGKIIELETTLARAQAMKKMLESLMSNCRCRTLEQCAQGFANHPRRPRSAGKRERSSPPRRARN